MIIVRTPLRVSFLGGGTDHPGWYKVYGPGAVISTSIDKYVYMTMRHLPAFFDFNYRVSWRILEQVKTIDEIQHPVVRAVLGEYAKDEDCGFEIAYNADLPARSGLGSSSAFTVAALHALFKMQGRQVSRQSLTYEAIRVEQELLKETVGSQDQTAVAWGGFNRIDFREDGEINVTPLEVSLDRRLDFERHLMMVFTGFTRDAGALEKSKADNFASKQAQLRRLYELVALGQALLQNDCKPLSHFGAMLHDGWLEKKKLAAGVSTGPVDEIYDAGVSAGAYGGKLLGAGGGGFLLFFAPPERHAAIRAAVQSLTFEDGRRPLHIPFRMEREGSQVVLHQPELTANYVRTRTVLDAADAA